MSILASLLSKKLCIAHRGARAYAPENTLEAARLGYDVGSHMWELDANYTKDFQLVILHDDTLTRTTNVEQVFPNRDSYRVCDFTLEEILSLDAGSWYGETDPFQTIHELTEEKINSYKGLKVPTLEEALNLTRELNWFVNLEIKNHEHLIGHERVTKDVINLVKSCKVEDRVLLSSFQHTYLREAKQIMPELPRGALIEKERPENPLALCQELEVVAYHPGRQFLHIEDIAPLREAGYYIYVWTVNDMEEAKKLFEAGITGIFTDFPEQCLKECSHYFKD